MSRGSADAIFAFALTKTTEPGTAVGLQTRD